MSYGRWGPW